MMNFEKLSEPEINPNIYKTSKEWRVFFFVLIPPTISLMTWLIVYSFIGNDIKGLTIRIILFLMGFSFNFFLTYLLFSIGKYRVELFPNKIVEIGWTMRNEIFLSDIDGFKILPTKLINQVQFILKGTGKKKNIWLVMNNLNVFLQWLNSSMRNLDVEEYNKKLKTILSNEKLGLKEEYLTSSFKNAKKLASLLTLLSLATLFWVLIRLQKQDEIGIWAMVLLPFLAISLSKLFPGLIWYNAPKDSDYPTISAPFILAGGGLSLRALLDWNILTWQNFWIPFGVTSLILFFVSIMLFREIRKRYTYAIILLFNCALYGYGTIISLNGLCDKSLAISYPTQIIDKHISRSVSRGTTSETYSLLLSSWGPTTVAKDVSVSEKLFQSVKINETILVYKKNGAFNIPLFFLEKKE